MNTEALRKFIRLKWWWKHWFSLALFSVPRTLRWHFISGTIGRMRDSPLLALQTKAWPSITDWFKRFGCLISSLSTLKDPSSTTQPWRTSCCAYTRMEMSSSVSGMRAPTAFAILSPRPSNQTCWVSCHTNLPALLSGSWCWRMGHTQIM